MREIDALTGELVDMRGDDVLVASITVIRMPPLVGKDIEDVGFLWFGFEPRTA